MKMFFSFIAVFLFTKGIAAQQTIEISDEILSTEKSHNDSLLAITTADSVYIINPYSFKIEYRWAHGLATPVVYGFHPVYNNVLLLQEQHITEGVISAGLYNNGFSKGKVLSNYKSRDRKYYEFPLDSISIWNVQTGIRTGSSKGNFYLQYGNTADCFVGVLNKVFSYQSNDKTLYGSSGSEIISRDGENQHISQSKKACRKLLLSPQNDLFAASFNDGYINDTLYFSFSIMHFDSHKPVIVLEKLNDLPGDFCFSKDGKLLAVAARWDKQDKPTIRIIDTKSGRIINETPNVGEVSNLEFSTDGQQLYYTTDRNEWWAWDVLRSAFVQKVWTQITSLNEFHSVFNVNEKLIVAGASWPVDIVVPKVADTKYLVESVALKDLAVFSKSEQDRIIYYADSTAYTMLMNDVAKSYYDPKIRFSADRNFLSSVVENHLQVWDIRRKKKLMQKSFEKDILSFPDKTGRTILVFEEKIQKSYNEYAFHLLRLGNSSIQSRYGQVESDTILNGSLRRCDCKPDPVADAKWICTDESDKIWQVNGSDLSMKPIVLVPDLEIFSAEISKSGGVFFSGKNKNEKNEIWYWDRKGKPEKIIGGLDEISFKVSNDKLWIWKKTERPEIQIWNKGIKEKIISIPGKIELVDADDRTGIVLVQYTLNYKNHILQFINEVAQEPIKTEKISTRFYQLNKDELLAEDKGFSSFYKNAKLWVPWIVQTAQVLSNTNFDVSKNGRYLLFNNRIVDLKEIEQWDIGKYNAAALLSDSGHLQWLETYTETSYSDKKAGFTIQKYTQGEKEPVRSKSWFASNGKEYLLLYDHEKILVSPDQQWAFSFSIPLFKGLKQVIPPPVIWDLKNLEGKIIKNLPDDFSAEFSKDGSSLIVTIHESNEKLNGYRITEKTYSLQTAALIKTRTRNSKGYLNTTNDNYVINFMNVEWLQADADSMKRKKSFYSREYLKSVIYDETSERIFAGSSSGNIFIWNRDSSTSPLKMLVAHSAPVVRMIIRGQRLYSLSENGEIGITDINSGQFKVLIKTLLKDDELRIAMSTPEGYYRVDPDLMRHLHFVKNDKVFPLSSFELQGNRPDKVYEALGLADTTFINTLYQSWVTRLRRAGFDPSINFSNVKRPGFIWNRDQLPAFTTKETFSITISKYEQKANLKKLFIKVNGVPVGSRRGIAINDSAQPLQQNISLSQGLNLISVIAVDDNGIESLEATHEILYEPEVKMLPRLVYIGIGVSKYEDSIMNLHYASKDVKDMARELKYYFDSLKTYTLCDEEATRENILAIKKELNDTNTEDVVMVSFSGHGMIEKGKGFFYAPRDMDFSEPSRRGVSMEMIEELLDDIPARRRLLLLDACHSGEEWNTDSSAASLPSGVTVIKPKGIELPDDGNEKTDSKRNSYLLMKELFSDFTRGNGSFMISAAASNEFAFEGDQWKNGVFTKSFLEALNDLRSKGHRNDAPIFIRELRKLIYKKVSESTNGLQNPTSRQENGWWNWSF